LALPPGFARAGEVICPSAAAGAATELIDDGSADDAAADQPFLYFDTGCDVGEVRCSLLLTSAPPPPLPARPSICDVARTELTHAVSVLRCMLCSYQHICCAPSNTSAHGSVKSIMGWWCQETGWWCQEY
jgi:hypothetical protein